MYIFIIEDPLSRRARLTLALVAALFLLAATLLLVYSLSPSPVDSLQATLVPTLMTPPQVAP
jgi:hypothetical protein